MTSDQAMKLLGLTENFTPQELKKAYRRMAAQYHPDVAGADSTRRFSEIAQAHKILSSGKFVGAILFTHQSIFTIVTK